ncbi:MAG: hypothetical protein J6V25_02825 [Oscillospiraceae bacterium]|nr:hypothetical protein [Oscillospiraceae bacterium]
MKPIFVQNFEINDMEVDCFGRLKSSMILLFAQQIAGQHCLKLSVDYDTLAKQRLFWAVTRHKVQITRLPVRGETIRIETWPMPTTRVAYPRSMVAYDQQGKELFRSISIWVLMDLDKRSMVLPGKSGITVDGTLLGNELAVPGGLSAKNLTNSRSRTVCFTDLDRNGHMNNTRYLDWISDLLPSAFHAEHSIREFTVCYLSEATETQKLNLSWDFTEEGELLVEAHRNQMEKQERIFAAKIIYD